ncbi:hypothetical protein ABZ348_06735 [Streptomyces sp. NPDC005963]|uniref:hypothetical protein n=1 Tax=Streptomyces sp. NPDC005963 TaxID=3156721 RepID=UPI0033DAE8E3
MALAIGAVLVFFSGAQLRQEKREAEETQAVARLIACARDAATGLPIAEVEVRNPTDEVAKHSVYIDFVDGNGESLAFSYGETVPVSPGLKVVLSLPAIGEVPRAVAVDCRISRAQTMPRRVAPSSERTP